MPLCCVDERNENNGAKLQNHRMRTTEWITVFILFICGTGRCPGRLRLTAMVIRQVAVPVPEVAVLLDGGGNGRRGDGDDGGRCEREIGSADDCC
ncbi:unnamed protein product [Gongylonema pulchrum]|uniref:Secreted protein n=1 Tax=Gongylonema pulchrum TaxID=637853 RepID=A0A183CX27_9BILA|nr:unnamed protein product [Gongylonema pulchrum]